MKDIKKLFTAIMAATMIFAVGCGNTDDNDTVSSKSAGTAADTAAAEQTTGAEGAPNEETAPESDNAGDTQEDTAADIETKDNTPAETEPAETEQEEAQPEGEKILVAYFSNPQTDDTDADTSASRNHESGSLMGNVEYTASLIHENVGGDLFQIKTVNPYPADYRDTTDQASVEQSNNARPELADHLDDISSYETVYIGFPNWWGDMPMAVYSFFDEYDLSGKEIKVFVCHGGSGASSTISTIQGLEPGANVSSDALTLYWTDIPDAPSMVGNWIG